MILAVSFFFPPTPTTEIYTLSLHDALPISTASVATGCGSGSGSGWESAINSSTGNGDRKSTRLNSSHLGNSYAVFCLKKKMKMDINREAQPITKLNRLR